MDIRDLEIFVEIAQVGNITRVAENQFVSQPALSQRLSNLENEIKVPLFERNGNKIKLTEAGVIFLNGAQSILYTKQKADQQVQEILSFGKTTIRCVVPEPLLPVFLGTIYPDFHQMYPGVTVRTETVPREALADYLLYGMVECALDYHQEDALPLIETEILWQEKPVLAVPASMKEILLKWKQNPGDYSGLASLPLVIMNRENNKFMAEENIIRKVGFSPNILYRVQNRESLKQLLSDGLAAAFLLQHEANEISGIDIIPLDHSPTLKCKWLSNRSVSPSPYILALRDLWKDWGQNRGQYTNTRSS